MFKSTEKSRPNPLARVTFGYCEGAHLTKILPKDMQRTAAHHLIAFHINQELLDCFIKHDQFFSQQDARDHEWFYEVANRANISSRGRPNRHTCGKLAHRSRLVVTPPTI